MNKQELVAALRDKEGITRAQAESYLNSLSDIIINQVLDGDVVKIIGFGRFYLKKTKARPYHNPRTGVRCEAAAREAIAFKQLNLGYVHRKKESY